MYVYYADTLQHPKPFFNFKSGAKNGYFSMSYKGLCWHNVFQIMCLTQSHVRQLSSENHLHQTWKYTQRAGGLFVHGLCTRFCRKMYPVMDPVGSTNNDFIAKL